MTSIDTMMVATCKVCRAWYNMDMEYGVPNEHWDTRTGKLCRNDDDDDWWIVEVPGRDDWEVAH